MRSALLSAFLAALMVVGVGCASNSNSSTGAGGASSSGGASGGTSGAGGGTSGGGKGGTAGAAGEGGKSGTGGAESSGGRQGSGGAQATGGAQGTGGGQGTGDAGRDVPAKDDVLSADTAVSKDGQVNTSDGNRIEAQSNDGIRTRTITTRGLTFDVREAGPSDGEPVLLLHGFPDTSLEWTGLMPVLAAAGYHCLAPDQRGYSPGARPTDVDAYKYEELVADAFALGSELGERFHVIGHDWGTNVGWLMLQKDSSKIASFTAISIPHYQVWSRSVYEDPAMAGYLSMLNTWMAEGKGEAYWTATQMKNMWKAKPADQRDATIAHMTEAGAMTAALNWYRASDGHKRVFEDLDAWKVSVPTLLIHGSTDIGEVAITNTAPLMTGPYRVVRPTGGHFIVDEQPKAVADETLAHLRAYPIQ